MRQVVYRPLWKNKEDKKDFCDRGEEENQSRDSECWLKFLWETGKLSGQEVEFFL